MFSPSTWICSIDSLLLCINTRQFHWGLECNQHEYLKVWRQEFVINVICRLDTNETFIRFICKAL